MVLTPCNFGTRAAAATVAAVAVAVLALSSAAGAHVTIRPDSVPAGSKDVELFFRVPNERDNASTVTLQVFFPTDRPLLGVDVLAVPGWTSHVDMTQLQTPVQTDDGPVSQVVSDVTWNATAGGITPGQYEEFPILAGAVSSQPGSMVVKALQTYSSGEVVRWIEVASTQDPSPANPAPVLTLSSDSSSATRAAPSESSDDDAPALAALALSALALVGVAVGLLGRRRSGSS